MIRIDCDYVIDDHILSFAGRLNFHDWAQKVTPRHTQKTAAWTLSPSDFAYDGFVLIKK